MSLENTTLLEAIRTRRSVRQLGKKEDLDPGLIEKILREAQRVPSAFNMQSYRILALSGESHNRLWDLTEKALLEKIGEEKFLKMKTGQKLQGFRGGNGTLLFFEDEAVLQEKGEIAKSYIETIPKWSMQGSGIIQYAVWLMLTAEGLSASLQHYNPLIDGPVHEEWKLPETWTLVSQMVYGLREEELEVRQIIDFETMAIFKS